MEDEETNFWKPCWACRVISGEKGVGCIVTETEDLIVAINPFSLNIGHSLVMPREHFRNLYELTDQIAAEILPMAAKVARAAKQAFDADGITLRQNNEAASDQHLFHFHLHVVPRFAGDTDIFNAAPKESSREAQEAAAAKLRAALLA